MTWVRLEGELPSHPKILKVGPVGGWLYIEGLCYAGQQRTDGFIPTEIVPRLLTSLGGICIIEDTRSKGKLRRTKPATDIDWPAKLVEAGLWERVDGGYSIHNYLERNPTKQYLADLHTQRREAGRRGGLAKALASASPFASDDLAKPLALARPRLQANAYHVTVRNDTKQEKPLSLSLSLESTKAETTPQSTPSRPPAGRYGEILARVRAEHPTLDQTATELKALAEYQQTLQ